MQNKVLLGVGIVLLFLGVFKPDLSNIIPVNDQVPVESVESYVTDAPADEELLSKAQGVVDILKSSDDSTRKSDCLKLSSLYCDLATLIELDGEDRVIPDTSSIREANSLSGKMLRLDIKNKYENLAKSLSDLVISQIGDDDVVLDTELRSKAVEAFRALSWAFYQGSK